MTMSDAVRAEYERVLARVIIKHGSVVVQTGGWYGWTDYNATTHVSKCGVATHGVPDEDTWYEFKGTFYEGDTSVHGMVLSGVTCKCGLVTDRSLRWQASVVAVATEVFAEAHSEWQPRLMRTTHPKRLHTQLAPADVAEHLESDHHVKLDDLTITRSRAVGYLRHEGIDEYGMTESELIATAMHHWLHDVFVTTEQKNISVSGGLQILG